MGGFVFFNCDDEETDNGRRVAGERALRMMRARGLDVAAVVKRSGFELHLYRKRRIEHDNLVEFDNGDFIAAVGTPIFEEQIGPLALTRLYEAFKDGRFNFEDTIGQYAVWICCDGRLYLFNDYRGMQHVYHDIAFNLVSTSFLAMHAGTRTCAPNLQEVYEYLTLSWYYGRNTFLKGINRLDRRYVHQILPDRDEQLKSMRIPDFAGPGTFEGQLEYIHELLKNYFDGLVGIFGDAISLGLTSGYDSRMTLAYLRLCGCRPNLYVQGPDDATDVIIAKEVAEVAGLPIEHDPSAATPHFARQEFKKHLQASALYLDGVHHTGLFQNWALVADARSRLPRPERLRLYGMVGEAFRRSIQLPERTISVDAFLRAWSDKTDTSTYRKPFDKPEYLRRIGDKLMEEMELGERYLTPVQTQLAYPLFKAPANEGWQMSVQNERAFALCPYADPWIAEAVRQVEMPFRRHGRFQSALISKADPVIAAVRSSHGHALSEPPPARKRWRTYLVHSIPAAPRPYLFHLRARRRRAPALPFYLQDDYLQAVFPDGCPNVAPLLDLESERDAGILSRAYSLELLLSGRLLEFT